ncbi:hypothetical protein DSL72_008553 [Monilinia vaccinii-corymbosi]|uniref:Uncharacterized protein n=1 Tax=Monilinia vaccinii-corymbosi TaxID=61207 RepID=A0A8A3PPL9_9HELO|nr:hypothetical protein DSL72_008553 [Monilinia vaccinii-corymbosi]
MLYVAFTYDISEIRHDP